MHLPIEIGQLLLGIPALDLQDRSILQDGIRV
jgi:hypothetical protein